MAYRQPRSVVPRTATQRVPTGSRRMRNDIDDDESEELELGLPPYRILVQAIEVREFHIYLSRPLGEPAHYVDLIAQLRAATENDVFHFYLNNSGGHLSTGLQLINAIDETEAKVVMHLDSEAYSMTAILFLKGDEVVIRDNGMLMFHSYSSEMAGKGNEQLAAVNAAARSFAHLMHSCEPFLSGQEVKDILNGQDLWLDATEIRRRLSAVGDKKVNPD